MAAHHAGHGDQTDVLAERCVREPAKDAGNRRAQTIRIGRAGDFFFGRLASCATFGDTGHIAHRFNC